MGKLFTIRRNEGEPEKVLIWKGAGVVFYSDIPNENCESSICLLQS